MDESLGSFKSLEDVHLKATYDMKAGGKTFKEGETIALFDKIQVSGLRELKDYITANGGFDNRAHVFWESANRLNLTFSQGVFSNLQFGLLNNARVIQKLENEPILITKVEKLESSENKIITLSEEPVDQLFVYDQNTGETISFTKNGKQLEINTAFLNVVVYYRYNYMGGGMIAKIGQQFLTGFLELEGKTRVKDDTSGLVTTGIIKIPKLKLMSGLSIKLGTQANPVVGNFSAVGVPVESRHSSYVLEFDFLNNDIDSDM